MISIEPVLVGGTYILVVSDEDTDDTYHLATKAATRSHAQAIARRLFGSAGATVDLVLPTGRRRRLRQSHREPRQCATCGRGGLQQFTRRGGGWVCRNEMACERRADEQKKAKGKW